MRPVWLNLEAGTARSLARRSGVTFDVPPPPDPGGSGWHALVVVAADTYFPEACVEDLPMWAAAEVDRGLGGPLRTRIAGTRPDDPGLPALRDAVMIALGATPDDRGAVAVVDQVYADRLLRQLVPPVITASCLAWYGHWRDGGVTPGSEITDATLRWTDAWVAHPDQRPTIDAQIVALAERIVGQPRTDPLEERAI